MTQDKTPESSLPPLPEPIKRYDPEIDDTDGDSYARATMEPYRFGDWVRFEDHQAALAAARAAEPAQEPVALTGDTVFDLVKAAGLDWHAGFDLDEDNRYATLVQLAFNLGARAAPTPAQQAL